MLSIRPAAVTDVAQILSFIRELAEYEKLAHAAVATEADLRETLFGARPCAEVLLAEWTEEGASRATSPAGFALFFHNYSTFLGKPGLYLEDLFVRPALRQKGIGAALLAHLARLALARGCGRFEWAVLDWNEPAIGFYRKLGALPQEEWTTFRVAGDALAALARSV